MAEVKTSFDKVLEEHRELKEMIGQLRKYLQLAPPEVEERADHAWASGMAERLTKLHSKVSRHFRDEEESGFLDELVRHYPRTTYAAGKFRQDHGQILSEIRTILSEAMIYDEGRSTERSQLQQRAFSLLDRLLRHEQEENDLFHRTHTDDLGSGD
jgi:hypothetical protein